MAKVENNKDVGTDFKSAPAEKTPVLTEGKGSDNKPETTEITPELVADLRGRIKDLEGYVPSLTSQKEELIEENEALKESLEQRFEKIESLEVENADLKKSNDEKDLIIEEQRLEKVQLKKDIADLGILNIEEKELPKEGEVVIRFLLSPCGRFKLPYNVGQVVAMHKEVAAEIVESAYAEYVD